VFFVLVFAWTWGIAALMVLAPEWVERTFGEMSATNLLFVAAVYAPTMLGILLSLVFRGRDGFVQLMSRLDPRRFAPWWLLALPAGILVLSWFSGLGAHWLVGAPFPEVAAVGILLASVTTEFVSDPGPVGEEFGWRGFALPRLLELMTPRAASLVLGVIWAVWHLPAFFISGSPQTRLSLPIFLVGAVAICVVSTWLFLRTSGSLLLAIVFHRLANSDPDNVLFEHFAIGLTIVAVVLLLFGGMDTRAPVAARMEDSLPDAAL